MKIIGIDVSKRTFDSRLLMEGKVMKHHVWENNLNGFTSLFKGVNSKKNVIYCLESTGNYSVGLAKFLHEKGVCVLMVNPLKTHAFAKMEMIRNKTDKGDSTTIARFAEYVWQRGDIEKYRYTPKPIDFECLQALKTRLDQISKSRTQEMNRLEGALNKQAIKSIEQAIVFFDQQINEIEVLIKAVIEEQEEI